MATTGENLSAEQREERAKVRRLEQEALGWKNILATRLKIAAAAKEEDNIAKKLLKLGQEEQANAKKYLDKTIEIADLERKIQDRRARGTKEGDAAAKNLERQLKVRKAEEEKLFEL